MLMDEIRNAIEKNLSSEVASSLREYLRKAEHWEKEAESKKASLEAMEVKLSRISAELAQAKQSLGLHDSLDNRQNKLMEKEVKLEVDLLKEKVEAEKRVSTAIYQLVDKLVSNPVIRRQVYENKNYTQGSYNNAAGRYDQVESGKSITETTEEQ